MGPRLPGLEINHKDGVKANCALSNLEAITHTENVRHAFALGLNKPRPRSEFCPAGHKRGKHNYCPCKRLLMQKYRAEWKLRKAAPRPAPTIAEAILSRAETRP